MALSACGTTEPVYSTPKLNDADQAHLSCQAFPEIRDVLTTLPRHVFLAGSDGKAVVTDGGHKWVRFDIVNEREAKLVEFGDVTARSAHFECWDDLQWTSDLITGLQEKP